MLTRRAGRWAAEMMGREGRAVSDAPESWGVMAYGQQEVIRCWTPTRAGSERWKPSSLMRPVLADGSLAAAREAVVHVYVDVEAGQLLDIVPGRSAAGPARWLNRASFTGITTESDTGEEQDNVPFSGTPSPSGPAHAYTFHTTDTFRL